MQSADCILSPMQSADCAGSQIACNISTSSDTLSPGIMPGIVVCQLFIATDCRRTMRCLVEKPCLSFETILITVQFLKFVHCLFLIRGQSPYQSIPRETNNERK